MKVRLSRFVLTFALFLTCTACGYRTVHGANRTRSIERFFVSPDIESRIANSVAADEIVIGLREHLARRGALEAGSGYPQIAIEVLRSDVASEGIAVFREGADNSGARPLAMGEQVGIVGRAWIVRSPGATPERNTGDMRVLVLASEEAPYGNSPLVAAGRKLGERLAKRILGEGVPSIEPASP